MANEIAKAYVQIVPTTEGLSGSISEAMGDEAQKAGNEGGRQYSGAFGSAMKALGKVALTAASTAIGATSAVVKSATSSFAEYEQLAGGAELMFGDAYDYIAQQAANAYSSVQMSQNEYLAQVNGFAVGLTTALDGNSQAAAELANDIVKAEADIVSATGNSAEAVQNAFNGVMKGNFTMLDNLGLGINATKEGMQEVIDKMNEVNGTNYSIDNVAEAQQALVDYVEYVGMADYAANEGLTTIQGSMASTMAAWDNLLTGMASGEGNIGSLFDGLASSALALLDNVVPVVESAVEGIGTALEVAGPKIAEVIPELLSSILPGLADSASTLLSSFASVLEQSLPILINALMDILPTAIDAILGMTPMLLSALQSIIEGLILALPSLIENLMSILPTLIPQIISGITSVIVLLANNLDKIIQPIMAALPDLIVTIIDAVVENLPTIISALISAIWNCLPILISGLWDAILALFGEIGNLLSPWFSKIGEFFSGIWESIKSVFAPVIEWVQEKIDRVSEIFHMVIDPWIEIFSIVWDDISGKFSEAVEKIKEVFEPVTEFFSGIWDGIKSIFGSVASWFNDTFGEAWENVKNVFSTGGKIFDGIKDGIADTSKTIVNKIISGINRTIKVPFDAINAALLKIKGIEIVGVKPFDWITSFNIPQIPELATGGVLERGQVGLLEGNGAEAVVPLERNREWIANVATEMNRQTSRNNVEDSTLVQIVGLLNALVNKDDDIYIDGDVLVGSTANRMDVALGRIANARSRGR